MSVIQGKPVPALLSYMIVNTNYTATTLDYTIQFTGSTNISITLPDATTIFALPGRTYTICNTGSGSITLKCFDGQTINGSATQTIQAQGGPTRGFSTLIVQSTGSNWLMISASLP